MNKDEAASLAEQKRADFYYELTRLVTELRKLAKVINEEVVREMAKKRDEE